MYYINLSLAYKLVIVLSPCFCFCLSLEYRGGGQDWGIKNEQPLGWEQWKRRKKIQSVNTILFFLPIYLPNSA